MLQETEFKNIIDGLTIIEQDISVPRNIRAKIKSAMDILNLPQQDMSLKIDKSLDELGEVADDPTVPSYTRMQIWSVVSMLENRKL